MINMTNALGSRLLGAAIVAAALITPSLALAQDYPPPYDVPPPYADVAQDQQIQGQIVAINGTWNITVHDVNGYADSVELHQGTIINPTGLTLEPGMNVTIQGYPDGPNFEAMEIDTPYQYQGPPPVAVYYGPGAWYPGYAYGWGPSFSLVFNIGTRNWDRRPFYFGGVYRRPIAPPIGWESRPHGFIGHSAGGFPAHRTAFAPAPNRDWGSARAYSAPERRTWQAPQRTYAVPQQQQQRTWQAPQRSYAAPQQPQQQRTWQAPQRNYAAPQPQQQERRTWQAPPGGRDYSRQAAPADRGQRGGDRGDRGDHNNH